MPWLWIIIKQRPGVDLEGILYMRVLWFIDSLGPGGAEKLMLPVLKSLSELGVENRVCVFRIQAESLIAEELKAIGIPVDVLPVRNVRNPFILQKLVKYIRHYQPNIIHTQLETSDILGTIVARLLHVPSVSTIHTLEKPSRRIKKVLRNFLRWNSLKLFSRCVIAVSEITRKHYLNQGFDQKKLIKMYNGIDLGIFSQSYLHPKNKYELFGLQEDGIILTTVAVLREQKGIQYMIQALPALLVKKSNIYYAIVGDGDYREPLEKMASLLGIRNHVLFMQYRNNIPELLSSTDRFVFLSLGDALPTGLLEAMAAGVPIVASEVGGIPEIIENDVNGLLVPPANPSRLADACLQLLDDKQHADRLTKAAHAAIADHFDVRQQAMNLFMLYREILDKKGN